jgi:predicted porin
MKKSLIALAALATVATAAQAQSSVTVYGIVDSGLYSYDNDGAAGTQTGVHSGGLSTSRIGFRGTEDLGSGLKANFTLETEIHADNGSQAATGAATALFSRGAFVQLDQAGVGSVTLGRQNRLDYLAVIAGDPFGAANVGGFVSTGYLGSGMGGQGSVRLDNALTLKSASFGGLVLSYQHGFGEQAGAASKSRTSSFGADFTSGKFKANLATRDVKHTDGTDGDQGTFAFASYNFGVLTAHAGYTTLESKQITANKAKTTYLGVSVPLNAKTKVLAGYYDMDKARNTYSTTTTGDGGDAKAWSLGVTYELSKRTTLYALHASASADQAGSRVGTSNLGFTTTAGKDNSTSAIGVRHTF